METYVKEMITGTFLLNGEGIFTGEADILLGEQFAETILNEGLHIDKIYGHSEEGEDALLVSFTYEPNAALF